MQVSKIVVGLGNPGRKYEKTPHNAGFDIVFKFAEKLKTEKFKKLKDSLVSWVDIKGDRIILALPQTFMNNSGVAVRQLLNEYKISSKDIIVCYDDLDLPFSTVKLRIKGGAGGHHGMESIISEIKSKSFPRVRLGVKKDEIEKEETVSYLLSKLTEQDYTRFLEGVNYAVDALTDALFYDFNYAMNHYNKIKEKKYQNCDSY